MLHMRWTDEGEVRRVEGNPWMARPSVQMHPHPGPMHRYGPWIPFVLLLLIGLPGAAVRAQLSTLQQLQRAGRVVGQVFGDGMGSMA